MILHNANYILNELSEIEDKITFFEEYIREQHFDVDFEEILHQLIHQKLAHQ